MVGMRKIGRPPTSYREEAEEDLNTMGIKNEHAMVRDCRE
jgi:hypothetical protein